jgi:hypothetical protein
MEGVLGWFARRGEVPLTPALRLREYAPLGDDPDADGDFTDRTICGVALSLEYCDSRGWASIRAVRCLALDPVHPARLLAYCNFRRAERTFRMDRIISLLDMRSGHIVSSDGQRMLLAPYLPPESEADPHLEALIALQDATRDGVFALLQLAMPDGRLGHAARTAVLQYIRHEAEAAHCVMPPGGYVELWVDNLSPPLDAVLSSVRNLLLDREKFARLLPSLLKVVRCQDRSAEEGQALRELIAEVRQHFRSKTLDWPGDLRATP